MTRSSPEASAHAAIVAASVLVDEIAVEAARPAQRRRQRRGRVTAPVGEDDGDQVADRPQAGRRARVQEGALSDAALPEEEGQS